MTSNPAVQVTGLSWTVGEREILADIHLAVDVGEVLGVVGPNGSGKSSLLRCLYRRIRPTRGQVMVDDLDVAGVPPAVVARRVGVVLQDATVDAQTTVDQVICLGRLPHQGLFGRLSASDRAVVDRVAERTGITSLRFRDYATLSGGERQRVQLARALAAEPSVLLLDEPTNHLDLRYQMELVELVSRLGITTIAVLHDVNLAALMCDRLVVLDQGRIVADGPPPEVLTPDRLAQVWQVATTRVATETGRVIIVPEAVRQHPDRVGRLRPFS